MPLWDKLMLRKRYIIECINELLKNKANLVHSRHRSVHNFLMNLCAALAAYCFSIISPRHCQWILKRVGNWNYSKPILIPNWRISKSLGLKFKRGLFCNLTLQMIVLGSFSVICAGRWQFLDYFLLSTLADDSFWIIFCHPHWKMTVFRLFSVIGIGGW